MKKIILIVAACIIPALSYAQKWEKYLLKEEKYFNIGDYEKGIKEARKLGAKAKKKLGTNNHYSTIAKLREGRNNVGLGMLNTANNFFDGLASDIKGKTSNNKEDLDIMLQIVSSNLLLERYYDAQINLEFADSLYLNLRLVDEGLGAKINLLKAEIVSEQGYYQKALNIVKEQHDYYLSRTQTNTADKKETVNRKREYARLLLLKANTFRYMGNYLAADQEFNNTEKWIESNLGKSDILYSKCLYLNTLLLEENGLEAKALEKFYDKAYNNTLRKYKPQHLINMSIKAGLIKAHYRAGKKAQFETKFKEYRNTIKTAFSDQSAYSFMPGLIKNYLEVQDGHYTTSGIEINDIIGNRKLSKLAFKILEEGLEQGIISSQATLKQTKARKYHEDRIALAKIIYGPGTPVHHLYKTLYANYLMDFSDNLEKADSIYKDSFDKVVLPEISEGHKDFIEILNHRALLAEEKGLYDKSSEILDKALDLTHKKYDSKDIDFANELEKIASLELKLGSYKKAKEHLNSAISILNEKQKSANAKRYKAKSLLTQAKLFTVVGEYDEAENNIENAFDLAKKGEFNLNLISADAREDLVNIDLAIGNHSEARSALRIIIGSKKGLFGEKSRRMIPSLLSVANYYYITGDYTETQRVALKTRDLSDELYGKSSARRIPSLSLLSKAYLAIGDLDKAEQISLEAVELIKARFGKRHLDYANEISNLALIRFYKKSDLKEVEELYKESLNIISDELGPSTPTYAEVVKNLAILNISLNELDKAEKYLNLSKSIWDSKIGKRNNVKAGEIYMLKGDVKYQGKSYNEADDLYQLALKKYESFFNDQHPEYVNIQSRLSKTYYMKGDISRSEKVIEEVLLKYADFIQNYFPVLSEREKAKFWNKIRPDYEFYNSLIISHKRINKNLIGKLFDNALITKSLLLNTSKKVRNKILNSNDESLIALYSQWLSTKERLSYALSLNQEQLSKNNININTISDKVDKIEKELSKKSQAYGNPFAQETYTWKDIKKTLKPGEVAMEIVRFRYFDHVFSDSVVYAAIYTKQDEKIPGLILLTNGADLEKKYLKYYRNSTKFQTNDKFSYSKFWKPIDDKLADAKTIFLSVDGVYNQVNLEAMRITEDEYVIDRSNIVLVNNTKDLLSRGTKKPSAENLAIMFGNPDFYVDFDQPTATSNTAIDRGGSARISELPGTAIEIKSVKELLSKNGWEIADYVEEKAREESLKEMRSPKIFHVATHGFFRSDDPEKSGNLSIGDNLEAKNPLLKSGLLLTGAGDILAETNYNYNFKEGILTAYEAMNLNLESTELVVLSACETGLGEVQAGEGVYGLQRAFLVAGAQSVIMSLFKVSDEATQKLMVHFYQKWLETGNKRESFIYAKKQIRSSFGHPTYWGPFVMIGLGE